MGDEPLAGRSLKELVGRPARLTIVHNETDNQTYANVASVKPMKPGIKAPKLEQDLLYFSLSEDEFSPEILNSLPERIQVEIKNSPTYAQTLRTLEARKKSNAELLDDGIPEDLGGAPAPKRSRRPKAAFKALTEKLDNLGA
jgi:hypothetical protein